MEWLIAVLVIAVLGVAAVVSSGGMGEMSKEPVSDVYRQDLPDTPLTGADIETLRFGVALRGYAMGQVDDVLARLGAEIADRDATIAELRDRLGLARPDSSPDSSTDGSTESSTDGSNDRTAEVRFQPAEEAR